MRLTRETKGLLEVGDLIIFQTYFAKENRGIIVRVGHSFVEIENQRNIDKGNIISFYKKKDSPEMFL